MPSVAKALAFIIFLMNSMESLTSNKLNRFSPESICKLVSYLIVIEWAAEASELNE